MLPVIRRQNKMGMVQNVNSCHDNREEMVLYYKLMWCQVHRLNFPTKCSINIPATNALIRENEKIHGITLLTLYTENLSKSNVTVWSVSSNHVHSTNR